MGMLKCYTTFGAIVTLIAGLGLLGGNYLIQFSFYIRLHQF
jgi:hypothetical protein